MERCPVCNKELEVFFNNYKPYCSQTCEKRARLIRGNKPRRQYSAAEGAGTIINELLKMNKNNKAKEQDHKEKRDIQWEENYTNFGFRGIYAGNGITKYICPKCKNPSLYQETGVIHNFGGGGGKIACSKCDYKKYFKDLVEEGGANYNTPHKLQENYSFEEEPHEKPIRLSEKAIDGVKKKINQARNESFAKDNSKIISLEYSKELENYNELSEDSTSAWIKHKIENWRIKLEKIENFEKDLLFFKGKEMKYKLIAYRDETGKIIIRIFTKKRESKYNWKKHIKHHRR